ncbi:hypothetical protein ACP4OV_023849 [Aristida adscensionis]
MESEYPINTEQPQNQGTTNVDVMSPSPSPPLAMDHSLFVAASSGDRWMLMELLNWGNDPLRPPPQVVVEVPNEGTNGDVRTGDSNNGRLDSGVALTSPGPGPGPGHDLGGKTIGNSATAYRPQHAGADEQPVEQPAAPSTAGSLLEGVTPQGDTALHVIVSGSSGENILDSIYVIHNKAKHLLHKRNKMGDTPLHYAARIGNHIVLSYFVELAKAERDGSQQAKALLRMQNMHGETALHDAIRAGSEDSVMLLLREDSVLACIPLTRGTSPLYLAIILRQLTIVRELCEQDYYLSYSGRHGQNALHAAVFAGQEYTKLTLRSAKYLSTQRDDKGCTPLHFAAGLRSRRRTEKHPQRWVCSQVLKANTAALYEPDKDGLTPIHVAASVGAWSNITIFVNMCPSCAGLRDNKGRTFLHVAVEKEKFWVVGFACMRLSLAWILNMHDNNGNTALHLAVEAGNLEIFSSLLGNREVQLNLTNAKGQTPLDVAWKMIPPGIHYHQNPEAKIYWTLRLLGAASRYYHFQEYCEHIHGQKSEYQKKELEIIKDTTQNLCIGSVLIATVTFGAIFALPGGYIADDQYNGGTPTLAGRYAFHAFVMANALAFVSSSAATVGLSYSGSPIYHIQIRRGYIATAYCLVEISITCLVAAFASAVYVLLGSVAHKTAIAICCVCPLVLVCQKAEHWLKFVPLVRPFYIRKGRRWLLLACPLGVAFGLLLQFWPLMIIFLWAAYGRNHPVPQLESPTPAPAPLT